MMKKLAIATSVALALTGCATESGMTKGQQGAIFGAIAGAVAGNQTGHSSKNRQKDRITGAVLGAVAGATVGGMMDKQEAEMNAALENERASNAVEVQRVTDEILQLTLASEVSFDINSARVKPSFRASLDKVAEVLVRYGDTNITIVGHTDSTGSDQHNYSLSVQRANAVVQYLRQYGVERGRMRAEGKGESQPVQSNSSAEGRRANRRVEVFVEQR